MKTIKKLNIASKFRYEPTNSPGYLVINRNTNEILYNPTNTTAISPVNIILKLSEVLEHGRVDPKYRNPLEELQQWVRANINNLRE